MANYFKKYPKLLHNGRVVTDLLARIDIRQKYTDKLSIYYPYELQDGDTPEIIAYKYYGDAEKHWLVLLANQTMDAFFDFPLSYQEFVKYINKKYQPYADSLKIWSNDSANNWKDSWTTSTVYTQNNIVRFSNTAYVCSNTHTSSVFSSDVKSSYWTTILDGNYWKSTWQADTYYSEQDVVQYNSTLYVCKQPHTSNSNTNLIISNADYWKTYTNPVDFCKVTINIDPPGYRAIISTTDISSGEETIEKIFIDKTAYLGNYNDDSFSYVPGNPTVGDDIIYTQDLEKVHIYDYEMELNESKRAIKLIRKEFAAQLEKELKYLMEQQYV